ncbi:hypothetical protein LINPERHAP2_LOCUS35285 [Linum perenne]
MYYIAWAVVKEENKGPWAWFLQTLQEELQLSDENGWSIISDQQKGLVDNNAMILPFAEHRKCARHVFTNWRVKNNTEKMQEYFWYAVYSLNEVTFNVNHKCLQELEQTNEDRKSPFTDFRKYEPKTFCMDFLSALLKCDSVESNICKTFDGWIVKYSSLRIIDMLERIRRYIMPRIVKKHKMLAKVEDVVAPRIRKHIEKEERSRLNIARPTLNMLCEVMEGNNEFVVDLNFLSCS